MKKENDILKMNNIINELDFTGIVDKASRIKTFFTITRPKLVNDDQNKTFDGILDNSDNIQ